MGLSVDSLIDSYERLEEAGKDTSIVVRAIIKHKGIILYIIDGLTSHELLSEILATEEAFTDDLFPKVQVMLIIDYLLSVKYYSSVLNSVSDEEKIKLCYYLYNIYNSGYILTNEESKKLDEALGLLELSKLLEEKVITLGDKVDCEAQNSNDNKLANLNIGGTVQRYFSNGDIVSAKVVAISPSGNYILCNYDYKGLNITSFFYLHDGRIIESFAGDLELEGWIAV